MYSFDVDNEDEARDMVSRLRLSGSEHAPDVQPPVTTGFTMGLFKFFSRSCEVITMDIIQEIKKRQDKISANTERIFKLQQQNMKLREEIRKLQNSE